MNGEMQESGLTEIIPFVCTLTVQGQDVAFLHPQGAPLKAWWPQHLLFTEMAFLVHDRQVVEQQLLNSRVYLNH